MLDPKGQECWVHWEFSREDWNRWAIINREERKQEFSGVWMVIAVACALVGAFVNAKSSVLLGALMGALGGLAYGLFIVLLAWIVRNRQYKTLLRNAAEVYIGPGGLFRGKWSTKWHRYGWHLKTVTLVAGSPLQIQFGFDQMLKSGNVRQNIFVPVPAGAEESAAEIVWRVGEVAHLPAGVSPAAED